ncbi:TetR family transcriptional regulator [Streptomyces actuosus]|uniref:TetR family transcriptional regulator n=1 Tax=Streptomyces actuosus TaxID=1885 RepID=A0ABS2VIV1_STRAS|nr:TetR family transcriptional regulator [Streptomyces actuosus]MBN0043007.1 TetR family transcriptional regulator [Streptomyces actuosus]
MMMNKAQRRGRRPGSPDTRAEILDVARRRFLQDGYHAVTLRSIATEAGVDLALISYFYGSKKGLFGAALALSVNPADVVAEVLEGDPATLPQRALQRVLAAWDDPESGPVLLALVRNAVQDDTFAALLRELVEREIVDRVAASLGGTAARRRAMAFCAQVAGLITTRYLLRVEPMASMSHEEIIRHLGPAVRQTLSEPGRRPAQGGPAPTARRRQEQAARPPRTGGPTGR